MSLPEAIREYKELINHREKRIDGQGEAIKVLMEEGAFELAKQFISVIEKNDTDIVELWEKIKQETQEE